MTCKFNTQRYSHSFHRTVLLWHFWLCPLLSFSYCFYFSVSLTGLSSFWFSRVTVTLFVKHFTHYIVFTYITSFVFKETQVSNLSRIILSGWDGWMASLTKRWVWVDSGSWWWTGRPGVLQSMGSQRVGHDWMTKVSDTEWSRSCSSTLLLPVFSVNVNYLPLWLLGSPLWRCL